MTYSLPYTTTESMIFTNALTDRTRAYNSPRRSKKNGNIPFLDCLVTRDYNRLRRTIYTENPHIPTYYQTNHHTTRPRTIRTLKRRAQLVYDSPDSLQDETDYPNNVFSKNNYNTDVFRRNTQSNADSNTQTNVNSGPVTTATTPHIRGTSETIARILQPYNIHQIDWDSATYVSRILQTTINESL